MESLEQLVVELKALAPDQLDRVARMVHELSDGNKPTAPGSAALLPPQSAVVRPEVLEEAVRNGWPAALFTEVIGQALDDFKRHSQPPYEVRQDS